jgi:hypothetical protein
MEKFVELSAEAIAALREAASSDTSWAEVLTQPIEFLGTRGIEFPARHTLELYEVDQNAAAPGASVGNTLLAAPNNFGVRPAFGERTCPPGSIPVRILQTTTECIKWGVYAGPPEWVPVSENSPYGRWTRPVQQICLQSITISQWVPECMTVIGTLPPISVELKPL